MEVLIIFTGIILAQITPGPNLMAITALSLASFIHGMPREEMMGGDQRVDLA